ncbi:MAG TPA: hypothetical protein VKC66_01625 [Xanthobacteraceae bacterium]|nr:hypothetical protein [Xanthobacteraceae bacterium]
MDAVLEAECNYKRLDILNYAKRLATPDGAHYLWGTEGEKPTVGGKVSYAPVVMDQTKLSETCFCAATIDVGGTTYVCPGRFKHQDLSSIKPSQKIALMPNEPVFEDNSAIQEVRRFIDKYGGNNNSQIGWGFELTPRVIKGNSIMDYTTKKDLTGALVWGEGCDDTQHFDCGGFVRHVVKHICGVSISGISDILKGHEKRNVHGEPMGTLLTEDDAILPADILLYPGHIAFAIDSPPGMMYSQIGHYCVAQAESATNGVSYGKRHDAKNAGCIRLSPSTLLNRKVGAE